MFDQLPKYPNDFFRYGGDYRYSYELSNKEVNQLIKKAMDTMLSNIECETISVSKGDTKVMVKKGELEGDYFIEIYKGYYSEFISFR
ncbi:hypothetical protein [Siminovitchia sp. 179-K 8D1 HS]|uniref:hypothetical protein n=1 Tax=Siminovitchia sp. 179-K 8D1 HS TaxID=3142385 RepID=UPI0039A3D400